MTINRKLMQFGGILISLPVFYLASSGPVLRYLYISNNSSAETGGLYRPMFTAASALKLQSPLDAYLRAWDVVAIDASGVSDMVATKQEAKNLVPQIKAYKARMRTHSS